VTFSGASDRHAYSVEQPEPSDLIILYRFAKTSAIKTEISSCEQRRLLTASGVDREGSVPRPGPVVGVRRYAGIFSTANKCSKIQKI